MDNTTVRGCGNIKEDFTNLCDLDALWGIIVTGLAALGLVLTFVFTVVFSVNLKRYVRHQRHRYSTLLYFVLLGVFLLFAFSIAFVVKPSVIVCYLRRIGFGMAGVVVVAPLFVGITRTWRMSYLDELRCGLLAVSAACLMLVEAIILAEWNILKQPVLANGRCEVQDRDLVYSASYNGFILILFFLSTLVACCKRDHDVSTRKRLSGFVISCLVTSIVLILLSAAWAAMLCYGNEKLGHATDWSDPTTAMFMVVSGLFVLIVIFSPIVHTMRRIYSDRNHDFHMSDLHSHNRGSYEKATSHSTLPTTDHMSGSFGGIDDFERPRSFRTQEQNVVVMSPLSDTKPVPTKRNGMNYRVDRVRPPTGGRTNPSLVLNEEDVVRGRY
uniref:G-protein coupled receptor family C group 5 member B-like n=1 Tax=Ciona intestinalis TaxID=7719 RepID=H2Y0X6_CIOIN|nr:G-protein coupled receptor family C group 5 member B-like [Ciona intestinalis]|eukprot:XP_002129397.1 G-protein coupled receptor family C group 5 member B-like [Ciona intestinalis]